MSVWPNPLPMKTTAVYSTTGNKIKWIYGFYFCHAFDFMGQVFNKSKCIVKKLQSGFGIIYCLKNNVYTVTFESHIPQKRQVTGLECTCTQTCTQAHVRAHTHTHTHTPCSNGIWRAVLTCKSLTAHEVQVGWPAMTCAEQRCCNPPQVFSPRRNLDADFKQTKPSQVRFLRWI